MLSGLIPLLLALTMYVAGKRLLDATTGRLASVVVWGSPAILLVGVTARVDVAMAWTLLLAHYVIVVCLARRRLEGWFWAGAFTDGLAL